jgi:hypothetical protein
LGLLANITFEAVSCRAYAPFPARLPFFKYIVEVVFWEGDQHRLPFCLSHLNSVKMLAFEFYLQSGKQKSMVGGGRESLCFVKNCLLKKEV